MWNEAMWLGLPREEIEEKQIYQGDMNGRFVYYRLDFSLEKEGELVADISANSRYRLWVNEKPVLSGPCRGDHFRHFYETVELGKYLKPGKNVLAVQVLLCDSMYTTGGPDDNRAPLISVDTLPAGHRLALEGVVRDEAGNALCCVTTGKAAWKVWLDNSFYLTKEPVVNSNMGALTEHIDFRKTCADWKRIDFPDGNWREAKALEAVKTGFEMSFGILKTFRMEERPIPLLYERPAALHTELGEKILGDAEFVTVQPGHLYAAV